MDPISFWNIAGAPPELKNAQDGEKQMFNGRILEWNMEVVGVEGGQDQQEEDLWAMTQWDELSVEGRLDDEELWTMAQWDELGVDDIEFGEEAWGKEQMTEYVRE